MKNNLTMLLCLLVFAVFSTVSLNAQNECIPAGVQPVVGTVTGSTGTFTFNNIPTGSVIEIQAPSGGIQYDIDMCATNTAGWTDGTNDSQVTVLDANAATANFVGYLDDGCTGFAAGNQGYGPTTGAWTSTAGGSVFLYVTEWNAAGSANCIADGVNSAYTMTVTLSNAATCGTATAGTATGDAACVDFGVVFNATNAGAVIPGASPESAFRWFITTAPMTTPTDPFNDPAYLGAFAAQAAPYDVAFTNDGTQIPAGIYYFTCMVYGNATIDATTGAVTTDPTCTFVSNEVMVDFKAAGVLCAGGGTDCTSATPGTITVDACTEWGATWAGSSTGADVPGVDQDAGFIWIVLTAPMTTPTDPLNDPAFLGGFGSQASPYDVTLVNDGGATTLPPGVYYLYTVTYGNATTDATTGAITTDPTCTYVSNGELVEFVAQGSSCAGSDCVAPTATASYDCATNMVIVDITDAGTPSSTSSGSYYVSVDGNTQVVNGAGQYSFMGSPDQTWTAVVTDSTDAACDVVLGVTPDCATACAGATEGVTDGGFEGAAGTAWTEVADTNGVATLVALVDPTLPFVGTQSAWLGGWGTLGSVSSVTQSVTIPANSASATLSFWAIEIGDCAAGDVMTVSVDGNVEYTQDGTNANCGDFEWHLYTVDLSAYADGNMHMITIQYDQLAMIANSNLFIDEVSLEICPCPNLSLTTSSTPSTCGDDTGSATVVAMGGTGYTYAWSNGMTMATAMNINAGNYTVTVTDTATGCTAVGNVTVADNTSTTALTVMTSSTPENCGSNDGSATVTSTMGGSGNYSYMWVGGQTTASVSGLAAGTYPVTVTDMMTGCSGVGSANVGSAGGPSVTLDSEMDASCNGATDGSIMISVSGGATPYTFAWSNGETTEDISGLAAGAYTGTVTDANMCPFVVNATVGEPMAITPTVDGVNNATCNGGTDGSILISVSGGTAPYSFSWSNGDTTEDIMNLAAGDYTGTITDANMCQLVAGPITITEPSVIAVAVDALNDASCNGGSDGSIMITVSGGTAPYSFSWSNGDISEDIMNLAAGDYTGTITDANGCELVAGPVTVGEPTAISVVVDNVDGSFGSDGVIEITTSGGTAPYTYAWSNGDTTEDIMNLAPGDYTGTITDANGCELVAGPVTVSDFVGVEDIDAISSFSLTPNPTAGDVRIEINMDANYDVELTVIDITGRAIMTDNQLNSAQAVFDLDLSNLTNGVYFARFIVDGKTFTERIVKTN